MMIAYLLSMYGHFSLSLFRKQCNIMTIYEHLHCIWHTLSRYYLKCMEVDVSYMHTVFYMRDLIILRFGI